MQSQRVHIFETADKLVDGLTAAFVDEVNTANLKTQPLHIVLSGGNTPKLFFQNLANRGTVIDWSFVHFYWGDERCVPPGDAQSNYRMTNDFLLAKIDIPAENIHRIRGESDPSVEADRYAQEIKQYVPVNLNGLPVFDWILLGLGEDGHTASIFPNMNSEYSNDVCLVAAHPQTGQKRVSLTMLVINAAKRVSFLVSGEGKAGIVSDILNKKKPKLPAAQVAPENGREWYLDAAAGIMRG